MLSEEIQPGMVYTDANGRVGYEIQSVRIQHPHVVARVKYADGGDGERIWEIGKEVAHVAPPEV